LRPLLQGLAPLAFALAAAFCVFGRGLFYDFVYDDTWFIVLNPSVKRLLPVSRFFLDVTTVALPSLGFHTDIYRPLPTLSFAVDHRLWGLRPFPYRAENLLLHAVNGFLVFKILAHLLRYRLFAAYLGAALFLLHPAQVESVVWVTQRSNLLALFGVLTCLWALASSGKRTMPRVAIGSAALLLGVLSKEAAVVTPLLLLALSRCVPPSGETYRGPARPAAALLPWAIAIGFAAWRYLLLGALQEERFASAGFLPLLGRGFMEAFRYAKLLVWPHPLTVAHDTLSFAHWNAAGTWAGLAGTLALALLIWKAWEPRPRAALGMLWLALPLLPILGAVPYFAERYLYLSLPGLAILFCELESAVWRHPSKHGGSVVRASWAALAIACALLSWQRVGAWRSDISLWRAAVETNAASPFAHLNLGEALAERGNHAEAIRHYEAVLSTPAPRELAFGAMNNLSEVYNRLGRPADALLWSSRALQLRPDAHQAAYNRILALIGLRRLSEASALLGRAERQHPNVAAWDSLRRMIPSSP
jgi:tetratricopeptide (TPR) repeat protein